MRKKLNLSIASVTFSIKTKAFGFVLLFSISFFSGFSQQNLQFKILNAEDNEAIDSCQVTLISKNIVRFSNERGIALFDSVPSGELYFIFYKEDFFLKKRRVIVPLSQKNQEIEILLESMESELDEVVVVSTRKNETNITEPMNIQVISGEEMEERALDKPSSISNVARELPAVQMQRTSASSGLFRIKFQGMNGKYLQMMKDGFPLYGGFVNNLGIAQIPPLDIKQVELVKGPSSILFGGDAVSGVLNLISKEPIEGKPEIDVLLNLESTRSVDAQTFISFRKKKAGVTFSALYRYQNAYDWDKDNFSDYPKFNRFYISPSLFLYPDSSSELSIRFTWTRENRLGGAMPYIQNKNDVNYRYFERNESEFISLAAHYKKDFKQKGFLNVKGSMVFYNRTLTLPYHVFGGNNYTGQYEINYVYSKKKHKLVIGTDLKYQGFFQNPDTVSVDHSYSFLTPGFFTDYTIAFTSKTSASLGLRVDYNLTHGVFALPQFCLKHFFTDWIESRARFGMGYKLPTLFEDEVERRQYIQIDTFTSAIKPDLSIGGNLDYVIRIPHIEGVSITWSQSFFYTHIFNPLKTKTEEIPNCVNPVPFCYTTSFRNLNGWEVARGVESGVKVYYRGFQFSTNYTWSDNRIKDGNVTAKSTLASEHIISIMGGYEFLNRYSIGVDAFFWSSQLLENGSRGKGIWELGINTQLKFKNVDVFANLENILDIRQTRYEDFVQPYPTNNTPRFNEIYAPLEGILFNVGIKLKVATFVVKNK